VGLVWIIGLFIDKAMQMDKS